MKRHTSLLGSLIFIVIFAGCSTAYKPAPISFKSPSSIENTIRIDGAQIGVIAYDKEKEASEAFGFDIIQAGMLPVQVVFDNQSRHTFEINGQQSFLEDKNGNMWPVLSREMAYERASKYTEKDQMLSKGASGGLMGGVAGALIGSAVGIVTGTNVGTAAGKGAAIGGTIGVIGGGVDGHQSRDAQALISKDLQEKSLQNKTILPDTIAYGILFYPAEADRVEKLRLQLLETDTGRSHRIEFNLLPEHTKS